MQSVAKGMPAETIAPVVKAYQAEVARLDVELRRPRAERPDIDKLRDALTQRAEQWKATLRAEPKVARLLLRRLVGPLTLWEESEGGVRWDAPVSATSLLDGLVQDVASPPGFVPAGATRNASRRAPEARWGRIRPSVAREDSSLPPASWNQIVIWLRRIDAVRQAA